jgi:uncharacterized membrane protein HdeD (DUF308 family)
MTGRPPGGICASVGLVAAQLLGLALLISGDGGATLLAGFWLALLACAAGVVHLVAAVQLRRRAGRRSRGYAIGQCALALSPTLAVAALIAVLLVSDV